MFFLLSACGEHEHTFYTKWSNDENNHWHMSACRHDVMNDNEKHMGAIHVRYEDITNTSLRQSGVATGIITIFR